MRKSIITGMIMLLAIVPLHSQEKKDDKKETAKTEETKKKVTKVKKQRLGAHVYYEVTVEDFESAEYTDKNIKYFSRGKEEWAGVAMRDQYPAPVKDSKKYLGIKLYGKKGNALHIVPPKKLIIDKFCRSISVWVYGKNIAGEFSILLKDAVGTTHRLVMGVLDYPGWRKLTVKLRKKIAQEDRFLNQNRNMEILKFLYKPYTGTPKPREHRFYVDDISAMVREKYVDRQDDSW